MNQYGQQPIDPSAGMQQLETALTDKPFKVDELQMKQQVEQQQKQPGMDAQKMMQMAQSIMGFF